GSDDVGLYDRVDQRWAFGTVAGDQIVHPRGRSHGFHGAHGEDVGIVSGRSHGAVTVGRLIAAVIAGGDHNHNSALPGFLDGFAQRIQPVFFVYGADHREIDNPDVVCRLPRYGLV